MCANFIAYASEYKPNKEFIAKDVPLLCDSIKPSNIYIPKLTSCSKLFKNSPFIDKGKQDMITHPLLTSLRLNLNPCE